MRFSDFVKQIEDTNIVVYKDFTCVRNDRGLYDTCCIDSKTRTVFTITFYSIEHAYNRLCRNYNFKSSI